MTTSRPPRKDVAPPPRLALRGNDAAALDQRARSGCHPAHPRDPDRLPHVLFEGEPAFAFSLLLSEGSDGMICLGPYCRPPRVLDSAPDSPPAGADWLPVSGPGAPYSHVCRYA